MARTTVVFKTAGLLRDTILTEGMVKEDTLIGGASALIGLMLLISGSIIGVVFFAGGCFLLLHDGGNHA